ncbi:MAG: DUF3108 domain-containing protein [Burkholderiaceae bacterium]|nr:DUF3108 domain-containing protein [Burkholderiaceae bacterium]
MSLALPLFTPSPSRPTWPLKGLALVLVVVLAVHAWLLGGMPLLSPWTTNAARNTASPIAMQTRVLVPAKALPAPAPSTPAPTRARAQATQVASAAGSADANLESFPPQALAESAQDAPELIAKPKQERIPEPPATATPEPDNEEPAPRYSFAPPVRLNYDVSALTGGNRHTAGAQITWKHDGTDYQASLVVTKFLVTMRQWTSKGTLTEAGLAPVRFGDKGRGSEVAAHFVREEGRVVFSANTPPVPLLPGAQDHLSVFMQLASLWAGEPERYVAGDSISFQSIGPRHSETWTFVVAAEEPITVPGGTFPAIKLTREPSGDYSTKAELWLAPKLAYLPAHIRLSESNGNVLDMVWTDSTPP